MLKTYKNKMIIFFFLSFITHLYLISMMANPYIGVNVIENIDGKLVIERINQSDGWARYTTISPGDILVKIDDKNPSTTLSKGKSIIVDKNGEIERFTNSNNNIFDILQELIIPITFSILTLLLCINIYKKDHYVAYTLCVFLICASISFFASSESGRGDLIANVIVTIFMSLGALFLSKFIYNLVLQKKIIQKEEEGIFKINSMFCLIVIFIDILNSIYLYLDTFITGIIVLIYFCLNIIGIIIFLVFLYLKNKKSIHKIFLKWLICINIGAFIPFILLHAVPFIFEYNYLKDDIAALFLFIIPIGYFYLVKSNQLIDINFLTNQSTYYGLISLCPTIIITFFIINDTFFKENTIIYFIVIFLVILIMNICLLFLKEKIEFIFQNKGLIKPNDLSYELELFTQKLANCMKKDDLERLLFSQIQKTLAPEVIVLVTLNTQVSEYKLEIIHQDTKKFTLSTRIKDMIQNEKDGKLLEYNEFIGIRIHQTNKTKTYLWIGYKKNQTSFNMHEKLWLINIIKYVRLVFENLTTVEKIIKSIEDSPAPYDSSSATLSRFLFQLSENERRRLASDLHDSALQDQILWYRKLDQLINENKNLPKSVLEQLKKIRNGMIDVIKQIRNTCNELRPNLLLELGLIESLNTLCTEMQVKAKYNLNFDFSSLCERNIEDYNIKICIYRVFQELLNNAEKHSNASQVNIYIWEDKKYFYLYYEDNGQGFNMSKINLNPNQMGLAGIKERVISVNGQVEITSEIGEGFKVYITFPR